MRRHAGVLVITLAILSATAGQAQVTDVARILADARQAMGGDAALAAVASLSVAGTWTRNVGPRTIESRIQIDIQRPDKCVRTVVMDNGPFAVTQRMGFSGLDLINETTPDRMPAEMKAANERAARNTPPAVRTMPFKKEFSRLVAALFAAAPEFLPMEFVYFGREQLESGPASIVEAQYEDRQALKIYFDDRTHLPVLLSWAAPPRVTLSVSSVVSVNRATGQVRDAQPPGAAPPAPPPTSAPPGSISVQAIPKGDPTAGMGTVEHRLVLAEFKASNGINWPHRFTESVDGQFSEEMRLGGYAINPKIDPQRFQVTK